MARIGARQMLATALLAGGAAYIDAHADQVDDNGHRLVVRNGFHDPPEVATAAGAVAVPAPRVNDKRIDEATGQRKRFSSAILPAWARESPGVAGMLPLLYLHGLSSGDFVPALEQFLGSAAGLSAATITFATVRLRQRVTKGPARARPASRWRSSSSRPPKARWRAVNAPHLVALVRAGAVFEKGKLVERPDESAGQANAA